MRNNFAFPYPRARGESSARSANWVLRRMRSMSFVNRRRLAPLAALVAAFILVSGFMIGFGGSSTVAQESGESHPAHIHDGTCGSGLGDVVYPLDNVGGGTMMGTPVTGQQMGATD